jgi:hypothetical protein
VSIRAEHERGQEHTRVHVNISMNVSLEIRSTSALWRSWSDERCIDLYRQKMKKYLCTLDET